MFVKMYTVINTMFKRKFEDTLNIYITIIKYVVFVNQTQYLFKVEKSLKKELF